MLSDQSKLLPNLNKKYFLLQLTEELSSLGIKTENVCIARLRHRSRTKKRNKRGLEIKRKLSKDMVTQSF